MDHTIEFQEDGDVLIRTEKYCLMVSSKKLPAISIVFRTMLYGHFREGRKILLGNRSVHEVVLPDDDIDSVLLLCKIIYERDDLIEGVPNAQSLLSLAVLCDKYRCTTSLETGLRNLIIASLYNYNPKDTKYLCTMLVMSYIINCNFEFQNISGMILDTFREGALTQEKRDSVYLMLHHPLVKVDFTSAFETKYQDLNKRIDRSFQGLSRNSDSVAAGAI